MARGCLLLVLVSWLCASAPALAEPQALTVASPALARTVSVRLSVESAHAARQGIVRDAGRFGRLVRESERWVELDVAPEKEAVALRHIKSLGEVRDQRTSTSDLSGQLEQARAALRVARASEERMRRLGATSVKDGLELERARRAAQESVEFSEIRVRELEQRSVTTRIRVQLDAPEGERIEPARLPIPWLETIGPQALNDPSSVEERDRRELRNYLDGAFRLEGMHADQAGELPKNLNVAQAALNMRVLGEATPFGIFGGVDAALGGGSGFAYELQLMLGAGMPIGERLGIGVASGPGIEGVTSTVPFGVTFPIELNVSWDMSRLLATKLTLRDGWVVASEDRKQGSELAPFGDELAGALHVVISERDREGGYSEARDGLEVGFEYRELMGAQAFIVSLGYAGHISDFTGRI